MAKIVKGEERGRPGKYIVDYRENGKRKWSTHDTLAQAKTKLAEVLTASTSTSYCKIDPSITLAEYGEQVIAGRSGFVKARTVQNNREAFVRIKQLIGNCIVKKLTPGQVIRFAEESKRSGLANGTVRYSLEVLTLILNRARIDGLIVNNPAYGIGKSLRLERTSVVEEVKALTLEEREAFLTAAADSRFYTFFRLLFGTGLRVGEALAVKLDDLDLDKLKVRVDETIDGGVTTKPKSNKTRYVDTTAELAGLLKKAKAQAIELALSVGLSPVFLFATETGLPSVHSTVYKEFSRILKAAKLSAHFYPHCTRHTYATLLLVNGENIQYVQQQLGHSSISLTADIYGKWIPIKSSGVQERIDHATHRNRQVEQHV